MLQSIRTTLKILRRYPLLLFLALVPSLLTFAASVGAVYSVWTFRLHDLTLWLGIPLATVLFIVTWLVVGSMSLLPVEDVIINRIQVALLGRVVLIEQKLSVRRVWTELKISLTISIILLGSMFLALIPFGAFLTLLITTYGITLGALSPLHSREKLSFRDRLRTIKEAPLRNLSLGIVLYMLLFLPVVNVFFLGFSLALCTVHHLKNPTITAPPL